MSYTFLQDIDEFGPLTSTDIELLRQAKEANPWYFEALKEAAGIMPARRANYSPNADPFENFKIAASILRHYWKFADIHIDAQDVAFIYVVLKLARALVGGDSDTERLVDSVRDAANYLFLWRGIAKQCGEGSTS